MSAVRVPASTRAPGGAGGVSAVIPNLNGADLIAGVLDSLARQDPPPHETIVVDNGSCDGSPELRVIRLRENEGFARAANVGIAAASGEFVALLNTDVELAPGWLGALVAALQADPRALAAGGKLLRFEQREILEEYGTEWRWDGRVRHLGEGESDRGQYEDPGEVFSVCAAAALYRRELVRALGGFDEAFFAYGEDVELAFRARRAGRRSLYTPAARAFHRRQTTSARERSIDVLRLSTRNLWLIVLTHYGAGDLRRHGAGLLWRAIKLPVYAARHGWFGSYAGAVADTLKLLPHVRRQRQRLRRAITLA